MSSPIRGPGSVVPFASAALALLLILATMIARLLFGSSRVILALCRQLPLGCAAIPLRSFGTLPDARAPGSFGDLLSWPATSSFGNSARAPPATVPPADADQFVR
jgi:hypothetical protein